MQGIVFGFRYKQVEYGGNRCNGFLYGDALMAATIVLIILPTILYAFNYVVQGVQRNYYLDRVEQDVVAFIEEGKASYDSGKAPFIGIGYTHFDTFPTHISYSLTLVEEDVHGLQLWRYTVQAKDEQQSVYEISTFLGAPLSSN